MLHVTNGDSAVEALRAAAVEGDVLPWRDALHEGPVPEGLDVAELRAVRARFVPQRGWQEERTALADMAARDARLQRAVDAGEEIVLWFETDLYDVLQLAQILDRVPPSAARLVLVGADAFRGVADLAPDELRSQETQPIAPAFSAQAAALWAAFRAPDPRGLNARRSHPILDAAVHRHRQQFPWSTDGLNRTERALLHAIAAGARTPAEAFRAAQAQEERPFLGDTLAFDHLAALPLTHDLRLTPEAEAILAGRAKWHQRPERWLGGVRLPAGGAEHVYDPSSQSIITGRDVSRAPALP